MKYTLLLVYFLHLSTDYREGGPIFGKVKKKNSESTEYQTENEIFIFLKSESNPVRKQHLLYRVTPLKTTFSGHVYPAKQDAFIAQIHSLCQPQGNHSACGSPW